MDGVIVIDKSEGWTSHDVVAKFRGIAKTRRIGHLGTLDPMATGVLPLAIGTATRLAKFYTRSEKIYEAGIQFGFSTDTYDRTGKPTSEPQPVSLTHEQCEAALAPFRGTIMQMPPQYSAKKIGGVAAYKSARKNIEVILQPVEIQIHEITILHFEGQHADLKIRCSGGTYIRSIAHDLGQALGCGAHLDSLRRTASAEFTLAQSHKLEDLAIGSRPMTGTDLIPLESLVPQFPIFVADPPTATHIQQGRHFSAPGFTTPSFRALTESGKLLAICDQTAPDLYHPSVVFIPPAHGRSL